MIFCQCLRILGLRVLGYTGDGEKASWIKTELGFDWAFNYKTQDVKQTLNIAAPNGVFIKKIFKRFFSRKFLGRHFLGWCWRKLNSHNPTSYGYVWKNHHGW